VQVADSLVDTTYAARAQGLFDGVPHHLSTLAKHSRLWRTVEMNLLILTRLALAHRKTGKLELELTTLSDAFEERLLDLATLCRQQASLLVFVTLCSRLRAGQSLFERLRGAETSVYFAPYLHIDSVVELHDAYNKVIRKVARRFDAPVIDVEATIPTQRKYFYDSMHLRKLGGQLLARAMVHKLLGNPTFMQLADDKTNCVREDRPAIGNR